MIDVSLDFMGGVPSSYVTTLLSSGSIDLAKVEIWRHNVFYLSRDHDIEVSHDFVGGVPSS